MAGYFLKRDSKIHGPLDGGKLVELARAGKLKPSDELASGQEGPWQPAASVSALKAVFDQLAGGAAGPATGQPAKPAETGQWFVNISGFAADRIEGPVSSQRIKDLIDEKQVNAKTQVMHPVETGNEWVLLRKTDLMQHLEQRKEEKRENKEEAKAERKQARQEAKGIVDKGAQEKRLAQIKRDAETSPGDPGKWQTEVTTDPTDDSACYHFTLKADTGTDSLGNPVSLHVRESNSGIEVYLHWGNVSWFVNSVTDNNMQTVLSRVGIHEAGRRRWKVSNDRKGTFLVGFNDNCHCIRSLMDEETAVFQVTPDQSNSITATFDVRGLQAAMAPYATEMNVFRSLPEVANLLWLSESMDLRDGMDAIGSGCLKILSMICFGIMLVSGVLGGLGLAVSSDLPKDVSFTWGLFGVGGFFAAAFIVFEISRRFLDRNRIKSKLWN